MAARTGQVQREIHPGSLLAGRAGAQPNQVRVVRGHRRELVLLRLRTHLLAAE